jgi:hypothetical protein
MPTIITTLLPEAVYYICTHKIILCVLYTYCTDLPPFEFVRVSIIIKKKLYFGLLRREIHRNKKYIINTTQSITQYITIMFNGYI